MSSQTSWPAVTPDFAYIFRLGQYQHYLRPADQKATASLNLAYEAMHDTDASRILLTERGPFLLEEKLVKMDELIGDTEEALSRVIRLLEPARIEQIGDESVRLNTKNTFVLRSDDPKAAATFARLMLTHNKLKTVLHDLRNIEETLQLENCDARANAINGPIQDRQPASRPPLQAASTPTQQLDPSSLIAWKRDRTRSRRISGSHTSSISGLALDAQQPRSPVSDRTGQSRSDVPTSLPGRRTSTSTIDSDPGQEGICVVAAEKLSVIHELDGSSTVEVAVSTEKPDTRNFLPSQTRVPGSVEQNKSNGPSEGARFEHEATRAQPHSSSKQATVEDEEDSDAYGSPAVKKTGGTFASFRERGRRKRESKYDMSEGERANLEDLPKSEGPLPAETKATQIQDTKKSQPDKYQSMTRGSQDYPVTTAYQEPKDVSSEPSRLVMHPGPADDPQKVYAMRLSDHSRPDVPIRGSQHEPLHEVMPSRGFTTVSDDRQSASPLQLQMSPQSSSAERQVAKGRRQTLPAEPPSSAKTYEITLIDPTLTRLPSLLRAGPRVKTRPAPYPVSDAGSGDDEADVPQIQSQRQTQSAIARPNTAPLAPQMDPHISPRNINHSHADEHTHLRSMSDTAVPQISVTRVPTIPRKPIPYRNGLSRGSAVFQSGIPNTFVEDPEDMIETRISQDIPPSDRAVSGPPSPMQSINDTNLLLHTQSVSTIHSLSVQGPSSAGSSRRSSVSDVTPVPQSLGTASRDEHPNPLSSHPIYPRVSQSVPHASTVEQQLPHEHRSQPNFQHARTKTHRDEYDEVTIRSDDTPSAAESPQMAHTAQTMHYSHAGPAHVIRPTQSIHTVPVVQPPYASAYQIQAATHSVQSQAPTSHFDFRSPAAQQVRHIDASRQILLQPYGTQPVPATMGQTQNVTASNGRVPPLRTNTEPGWQHSDQMFDHTAAARRASENAETILAGRPLGNMMPMQQQASTQLDPQHQLPQQILRQPLDNMSRQAQQAIHATNSINGVGAQIRTAPPAEANRNEKRLPLPVLDRGGSLNNHQNANVRQSNKELFGRAFRGNLNQAAPPTDRMQQLTTPQQQQTSIAMQMAPQQPPMMGSRPAYFNPQNMSDAMSPTRQDRPKQYLAPVQEGSAAEPGNLSPANKGAPISQATTPNRPKRRESWLAYQVNKLTAGQRGGG